MAIQNRETTLPGIWAENAQTTIPTPPVAGVTYRDTTLNSTAIDKAWPFKTIVDSSDFNQHAFLQDTLIKEAEQYGIMRWNNTTSYKEGGFCLGQDGKLYQALRDNQGKEPTASTDDWKVFTSGGGFPIGSIGYTLRTEVPEGGAWCDGAEYTQAQFPDVYQMLVDGKLSSTDYSIFNNSVSTNGYCALFALDSSAQKFKVPKLLDKYVMDLADDVPVVGNGISVGFTNGTNNFGGVSSAGSGDTSIRHSLAAYGVDVGTISNAVGINPTKAAIGLTTDPDKSGMIADTSNLGKTVTLKAYVVLYSSAAGASEVQAAEFIQGLSGKADTDLSNVSSSGKETVVSWVMPDYSAGVTGLTMPYTAPCDGYITPTAQINKYMKFKIGNSENFVINSYSWADQALFPISKGESVVKTEGDFLQMSFFPFKGVN